MDIFNQLSSGADVDMSTPGYAEAIKEMMRCNNICFKVNTTEPNAELVRPMEEELFNGGLDKTSYLMPPIQIDFGCQMKIGKGVFVNHSLTCMAAGGITIDDGVMIGPNVRIVTDNHDFDNRMVLRCKPVHIKSRAWIGVGAIIRSWCRSDEGCCSKYHRRRKPSKVYKENIIVSAIYYHADGGFFYLFILYSEGVLPECCLT